METESYQIMLIIIKMVYNFETVFLEGFCCVLIFINRFLLNVLFVIRDKFDLQTEGSDLAVAVSVKCPNCALYLQSNFDTMPPFGTERKWHSSEGGIVTRICKNSLVM